MKNWHSVIIPPTTTVIDAMSVIDKASTGIAFICEGGKLVATLTDGDIRRHILKNGDLSAPVSNIGNCRFKFAEESQNLEKAEELCRKWELNCIPILDIDGRLVNVHFHLDAEPNLKQRLDIPVVIMAGGKGTRLHPYTKVLPKPLIPVGDLTITEHIMCSFIEYGCENFKIIVNHKKNMIKAYFADNSPTCRIDFLEEGEPLGTGGGLGLLSGRLNSTFFMTNCDILIFEDYARILELHRESGSLLTMVCTTKRVDIPYGTVEINGGGQIVSIAEKPSLSFLANTGFYVIEPEFLDKISKDTFNHMTDLILDCINRGEKVSVYPVSEEQWADMGQLGELEKMRGRLK